MLRSEPPSIQSVEMRFGQAAVPQGPLQATAHWLEGAVRCPSPNCAPRPGGEAPSLLVVHGISLPPGEFGGGHIQRLFCNGLDCGGHPAFADLAGRQVSAHLLIERGGGLSQFVPFDQAAWHAGESCFGGRARCNDFSIGVELEGTDEHPYEARQYECLAAVAGALMRAYPLITPARITSHANIAPGRKTDPGPAFDWRHLWRRMGLPEGEAPQT